MSVGLRLIEDIEPQSVYEAVDSSRDDLRDWMAWLDSDYDVDTQRLFHRRARGLRESGLEHIYAIVGGGRVLGVCSLHRVDRGNATAEAGYWVRTDARRRGVAVAAVTALLARGFGALGLARVELVIDCGNTASIAVARRLGAVSEGRLAKRLVRSGVRQDAWLYALVRDDVGDPTQPVGSPVPHLAR